MSSQSVERLAAREEAERELRTHLKLLSGDRYKPRASDLNAIRRNLDGGHLRQAFLKIAGAYAQDERRLGGHTVPWLRQIAAQLKVAPKLWEPQIAPAMHAMELRHAEAKRRHQIVQDALTDLLDNLPFALPADTRQSFDVFFDQGEVALAFDTVIWEVGWNRLPIRVEDLSRINAAGEAMGLDPAEWPGLRQIVENPDSMGPPPDKQEKADMLAGRRLYYRDGTPKPGASTA